MDELDTHFDQSGPRDEVVAALDASITAHPSGALRAAKVHARDVIAAFPDQWAGCSIRWQCSPTNGWTISVSYCTVPRNPSEPPPSTVQPATQSPGEASP